jgi:hypothetical protein
MTQTANKPCCTSNLILEGDSPRARHVSLIDVYCLPPTSELGRESHVIKTWFRTSA